MLRLARHITLRQLQVFTTIARLNSFTRAAEELHLTQPTVSAQIKSLTDAAGLPLFEQIGKKIYLTAAGRELNSATQEIFRSLDHVEMKLAALQGLRQGNLSVAAITTAKYFVPEVMGKFVKQYPDIDVSITLANRDTILQRLASNSDDLYILGHNPPTEEGIKAIPFTRNPLYVMAHKNHPLARKRNIGLEQIADEPFIAREPGSGIRDATEKLFARHGLRLNVRMELSSNEAIKHALAGELGVSVLSLHSILWEGSRGPLTMLDVEEFPIERQWHVVFPHGKMLSVVAEEFLRFLHSEGKMLEDALTKWMAKYETQKMRPRRTRAT